MPTRTGIKTINYVRDKGRVITYTELAVHLDMQDNWVSSPLRPIRKACLDNNLPRFDALVVGQDDGLPGKQFNEDGVKLTQEQHNQLLAAILRHGLDRLCRELLEI